MNRRWIRKSLLFVVSLTVLFGSSALVLSTIKNGLERNLGDQHPGGKVTI